MLVLAELAAELDRADAERMVEHHVEADRMALEAAEVAGIVALLDLRAILKEARDRRNRERAPMTTIATSTTPTAPSATKRMRALALRSVTKRSAPTISVVMTVSPQVAREKERNMPMQDDEGEHAAPKRRGERPRQRAADEHDERQDQERAEDVRILEAAGRRARTW